MISGLRYNFFPGQTLSRAEHSLRFQHEGTCLNPDIRERLWPYMGARSYRTLRDGSFEGRFPWHFVPGYDRCCPYGTRLQTFRNSIQLAKMRDSDVLKVQSYSHESDNFIDSDASRITAYDYSALSNCRSKSRAARSRLARNRTAAPSKV